jgi:hypothetical protein
MFTQFLNCVRYAENFQLGTESKGFIFNASQTWREEDDLQ